MTEIMDKKVIKYRDMERLSSYIDELRRKPRLTYLFLELTSFCNLKCLHCGSGCLENQGQNMDTELLFSALETIAEDFDQESFMLCISGGEPMLHPEFKRIIRRINEMGFLWGMTTNGTMIDSENAKFLKENGIKSVSISLDGLEKSHDELRRVKGAFSKTVAAIEELKRVGVPVQTTTVIHKRNFDELDNIYELMCELGVCSWRVINIEPIGRALEAADYLLDKKEFDVLLEFIKEKRFSVNTPMDVRFGCSHYLSIEHEREVRDDYFICGSGIMVGSILCNGDIYSCLDIERRSELVQGNISNDRFSDVWYNRFKEFREDRSEKCRECSSCTERNFCRGDSGHTWDYDNNRPLFCIRREEKYNAF